MRLAWTLLIRGGASNWRRLGLTAAAVALGMLMLLMFASGVNGLKNRTYRGDWHMSMYNEANTKPVQGVSPLYVKSGAPNNLMKWHNEHVALISMYQADDSSLKIPGVPVPKPGEYYVSPGFNELLQQHPEQTITKRFGGHQVGVLSKDVVQSPDELLVVRGMTKQEAFDKESGVAALYKLQNSYDMTSIMNGMIGIVLLFGGSILLLPIVMFISIATQLGSAQREKRYAAMRLIGATKRQVGRIMSVESLTAAVIGIAAGSLVYLALLPLMSEFHLSGSRFWMEDLTVPLWQYGLFTGLTLLFCWFANWWGMRRAQLSPLGVSRSAKIRKRPSMWRLVLFVPGIAVFVWMATPFGSQWLKDNPESTLALLLPLGGIFSVMFGLLLAGPWLTNIFARLASRRTRSVTTLLAGKRIASQSKQIFRSVSGVVLALFAGSFYLTVVSGLGEYNNAAINQNGYSQVRENTALITGSTAADHFQDELADQKYVRSVAMSPLINDRVTVLSCHNAELYTEISCPAGEKYVGVNFEENVTDKKIYGSSESEVAKQVVAKPSDNDPSATTTKETTYIMMLDSNDSIDALRTFVVSKVGIDSQTFVISGTDSKKPIVNPMIPELANLAYIGMGITLFVAIASLIVSTIGGLLERKRSFATLRLGGMTVKQMERTVMVESLIPLISVSLLACALGVWVGSIFTVAVSSSIKPTLTPLYFGIVIGALVLATIGIRGVVPMLAKITRPEENQTE